jgi:SOS-response transcriptional repressor LexA
MGFSERLKTLIKAKNTSQKAIAEYLCIRRPSISDWKHLETIPGADIAIKLAKYLGVSVEYLITGEDEAGLTLEQRNLLQNYDKLNKRDRQTVLDLIETMLKNQQKEEKDVYPDIQPISFETKEAEPAYPQPLKAQESPKIENDVEFLDWEMVMIPFFGKTAAGTPLDIYAEPGDYIPFPRKALKGSPEEYFVLSIQGYSMVEADIDEGDKVVIRYTREPIDGKIMLVRHEGASTLKRLSHRAGKWYLCWDDNSGREIKVNSKGFEVQGLHVWTLKPGK